LHNKLSTQFDYTTRVIPMLGSRPID